MQKISPFPPRIAIFGVLFFLLSGLQACSQAPQRPEVTAQNDGSPQPAAANQQAAAANPQVQVPRVNARPQDPPPELPAQELTETILYEFLIAEIAAQRGDVGLAAQAYVDLAKRTRDPRIARRAMELAMFSRMSNAAVEAARIWHDADPRSTLALQGLIGMLISVNRFDEAEPHLKKMLSAQGANVGDMFSQVGRTLAGAPNKAGALQLARALAANYPANAQARFAVAQVALAGGNEAVALEEIRLARTLRNDWEAAVLLEAQILQRRSNTEALQAMRGFLKANPTSREVRLAYARALVTDKRVPEARAWLQASEVTDSQQSIQLLLSEAQLLRDANQPQVAFELLSKELDRLPNNPDLLYDHAMLAEKIERLDVLESSLRKLIGIRPDHAHAYNALGYSLADRNLRLSEARELIEKALNLAPEDAFIIDSMGWVLFRQGHIAEAVQYLRRAFAARPDAEIAAHLAEVLWVSGERAEAERIFKDGLDKNPGNDVLLNTLKRIKP